MKHQNKSLAIISLTIFSLLVVDMASTWADGGIRGALHRRPLFAHKTLEQAWRTAVARRRPMLVMFSTEGCHFCTKMMAETYSRPEVQQMLRQHVETVKVDAQDNPSLVERLGIRGYPTTLLVSPDGNVLDAIEGFASAKVFTSRIGPLLKMKDRSTNASADNSNATGNGRAGS